MALSPTRSRGGARRLGLTSTGGCVVVAAVLVMLNFASSRYFFRLDFTENKIYSLSTSSKKLLSNLADPLRIHVFFDETVPVEYAHLRRYLMELLQEMAAASRGKMTVYIADMKKPESREEARAAGIAPLRFTVVREDKFEVQEGMMGLAIHTGDKKEAIPAVTQTANLEYDIAGRIVKLTRKSRPVIGWAFGHGEIGPPPGLSQYLSEHYELKRMEVGGSDSADSMPAISALLIAGPREPYTETALRMIDRTILSGIPTALLIDFYDVHMGNFFAQKAGHSLERLLNAYGLGTPDGLVVDAQNVPVQIQNQQGFFTVQTLVNYPYIPRVTDLSKDHIVTRDLTEIALPFVSALDVQDSSGVTVLARTSAESYRVERPFLVGPTHPIDVASSARGPFVLGVSVQGRRRSAFPNAVQSVGDVRPASETPALGAPEVAFGQIRMVVLSNAGFLDEERGGGPGNKAFAENLIDYLAASEDLISIRSKANTYRPLEKVSDKLRIGIKSANLFLMPSAIMLLGLLRWQRRLRRRRKWAERTRAD